MTQKLHDGQCGLCTHFAEHTNARIKNDLVAIRKSHEADEDMVAECGHPKHAPLHLMVTPISGCDGFKPAPANP